VLAGLLRPLAGSTAIDGQTTMAPLHARARMGLSYVADDRSLFMDLTVSENLRLGHCALAPVVELFPELAPLVRRRVGLLSGGEQQMVAVGRAISRQPHVLIVDELSLGLGPIVVDRLLDALQQLAESGSAVLVVEQQVRKVLRVANYVYVLNRGTIVMEGSGSDMQSRSDEIEAAYLTGVPGESEGQGG
jgi:branched-chain amino acid transport system ATP-binding protein